MTTNRRLLNTKTVWLLKKEVKSLLRSRWLIFGLMLSPIFAWLFQGAFLSFIVAQTTEEPETVYITLEDEGEWGIALYRAINANKTELLIDPLVNVTKEDGESLVANKTVSVWVYIPANFTQELETKNQSTLVIWVNTGNFRANAAAIRIDGFSKDVITEIQIIRDLRVSWITIAPEATYGHQLAIFLVMITSVLAPSPYVGQSFAGERERHTLEALLVVPMSRLKILASKLVAGLVITLIYLSFSIVGILLYNLSIYIRTAGLPPEIEIELNRIYTVDPMTIPLIAFCQFLVLLCAIGIGVVISTIARDQATAEMMNNLVLLLPTMVIGMLAFTGSITQYGGLFGFLVLAIPFTHAIMFLNGVLSGVADPIGLAGNVAYLLIFTIVFLAVGAKLFEREAIIS